MRRPVLVALPLIGVVAALVASAAGAGTSRVYVTPGTPPLRTAILDPRVFAGSQQAQAFAMTRGAGVTYIRMQVLWRSIAPAIRPLGFVATDPTSPGYSWTALDATVEAAEAAGLTPILDIASTPAWAFAVPPKGVNAGTPDSAELGDFATALATHYNGLNPGTPFVYQVWNEPNLSLDLNPVNANAYRTMINSVADAVHAVNPSNIVLAGALDPFGHKKTKKQQWYSVAPLAYMRSLLCLSKGKHPHATCNKPVEFDAWSHHPYTFGGPFGKAKLPDDVELGDLPKMRALLKAGVKLHHVVSSQPVQFWVTEFGWDSKPPRPHAAPMALASRWTAESLHQMWLSGVSLVTWFLLQDFPSPSPYQSGLYFYSPSLGAARAKPVLTAFRFPFVAYLGKKKTVSVWGRDATSDQQVVTVQIRHGKSGKWRTAARIRANGSGIFKAALKLKASKKDWLRAKAPGSGKSLAFSLKVPRAPNIGPWGN
jgi:Cellulase (glycosyl hydrolase family 5)